VVARYQFGDSKNMFKKIVMARSPCPCVERPGITYRVEIPNKGDIPGNKRTGQWACEKANANATDLKEANKMPKAVNFNSTKGTRKGGKKKTHRTNNWNIRIYPTSTIGNKQ